VALTIEELRENLQKYISMERASDYSRESLRELYRRAIDIRRMIDALPDTSVVPFEILKMLANIDFGAVKREYRTWVLDDAEKAILLLKI